MIGAGKSWTIPAMNRALVEAATHPDALEVLAARLSESDNRWKAAWDRSMGKDLARGQAADFAIIKWGSPAADFRVADERIATRLGLGDIEIEFTEPLRGPFPGSETITRLVIPARLLDGAGHDAQPVDIIAVDGCFSFRLNERVFSYGRYGLERLD
jgi:CRISPR-associated endonuclease/helicase Cas3